MGAPRAGAQCAPAERAVPIDNDILSVADLADTLKQPESKILDLLESGALPGRRLGEAWYVSRRQLLAYIEGDDAPARPKSTLGGESSVMPFGEWRCIRCNTLNNVDRVECSGCKTARMVPLMGFRPK